MLADVKAHERLRAATEPKPMTFDGSGNLPPL